jgi:OOP family OmpA-OmpF porin
MRAFVSPSFRLSLCLAVSLMCLTAGGARGQTPPPSQGFALDRYLPSAAGSDWFAADSLRIEGHLVPALRVVADYGADPLVFYNADGSRRFVLVKSQLFAHVGGTLALWNRLRVGFNLPVAAYQNGDSGTFNGETFNAPTSGGLGDLSLTVDARLLGRYGDPFAVAVGAAVFLPTGPRSRFLGEGTVRVMPRLTVAGTVAIFMYSASAGLMLRSQSEFAGVERGSEMTFSAAAGVALLGRRLVVGPEVYGATGVGNWAGGTALRQTPTEALLGAHYKVTPDWTVGVAGTFSLTTGFGSPEERFLASLAWAPGPPPPDHELPPSIPPPPPPPAPVQLPPPVADRDGDGVLDGTDACPAVAGPATSDPATTGCPPAPPPADRDGDGVADAVDACPDAAGPAGADPARNGCPLPAERPPVDERIFFASGVETLSADSIEVLIKLAAKLTAAPELQVRVEGYADDQGAGDFNKDLSRKRAHAVVGWLAHHGVATKRLTPLWFGADRPANPNQDAAARKENRRVEIHQTPPATASRS